MKILGLGFNGYVGKNFQQYKPNEIELISTSQKDIDITKQTEIYTAIYKYKPDVIINCAAETNEDKSEIKHEDVYNINLTSAINLTRICNELNVKLVHIDSCFSEEPTNQYAYAKYGAREVIKKMSPETYIPCMGWLFGGVDSVNFDTLVEKHLKQHTSLFIDTTIKGSPTYIKDAITHIYDMILSDKTGFEYVANSSDGGITRWEMCDEICKALNTENIFQKTEHFEELAKRPANVSLPGVMRDWKEALIEYYNKTGENNGTD